MDFKTIKGVPIVSTGTYPLNSGETTFTADDLASAVLAANDPTVSAPRIKLGHIDKRFEADPSLDGEPAFGTVQNMALSDDGQTLIGDLTDVPTWLADSMQSSYPGRSIEGGLGYKAPSGHDYKLAISNLALLGTTLPGVGSIADLRDVLSKNGKVVDNAPIEAKSQSFVMAKVAGSPDAEDEKEIQRLMREKGVTRAQATKEVAESKDEKDEGIKAGLDFGAIPRTFATDLRAGKVPKSGDLDQSKWWPRSVEAGDDGALSILVDTAADKLLRLPITVADKALNYGEPTAVTASVGPLSTENLPKGSRVLASYPSQQPTRQEPKTMKLNGTDVDQVAVAKSLGLADDADEKTILAKLGVPETAPTPDPPKPTPTNVPDGMVLVDASVLSEVQAGAAAGKTAAEILSEQERDKLIVAAIEGKVPGDKGNARIVASSRPAWEDRWKVDPEGTKTLLTASADKGGLAAVIPAGQVETGHSGDGEDGEADAAIEAAIDARFFPELVPAKEAA
jgi:hypothetical protein